MEGAKCFDPALFDEWSAGMHPNSVLVCFVRASLQQNAPVAVPADFPDDAETALKGAGVMLRGAVIDRFRRGGQTWACARFPTHEQMLVREIQAMVHLVRARRARLLDVAKNLPAHAQALRDLDAKLEEIMREYEILIKGG